MLRDLVVVQSTYVGKGSVQTRVQLLVSNAYCMYMPLTI